MKDFDIDHIWRVEPTQYEQLLAGGDVACDEAPAELEQQALGIVWCPEAVGQAGAPEWLQLAGGQLLAGEADEVEQIARTGLLAIAAGSATGRTRHLRMVGHAFALPVIDGAAGVANLESQLVTCAPQHGVLVSDNVRSLASHRDVIGLVYSETCMCCTQTYAVVSAAELRGFVVLEAGSVHSIRCRPSTR